MAVNKNFLGKSERLKLAVKKKKERKGLVSAVTKKRTLNLIVLFVVHTKYNIYTHKHIDIKTIYRHKHRSTKRASPQTSLSFPRKVMPKPVSLKATNISFSSSKP